MTLSLVNPESRALGSEWPPLVMNVIIAHANRLRQGPLIPYTKLLHKVGSDRLFQSLFVTLLFEAFHEISWEYSSE
jgi:hypothetical protein